MVNIREGPKRTVIIRKSTDWHSMCAWFCVVVVLTRVQLVATSMKIHNDLVSWGNRYLIPLHWLHKNNYVLFLIIVTILVKEIRRELYSKRNLLHFTINNNKNQLNEVFSVDLVYFLQLFGEFHGSAMVEIVIFQIKELFKKFKHYIHRWF